LNNIWLLTVVQFYVYDMFVCVFCVFFLHLADTCSGQATRSSPVSRSCSSALSTCCSAWCSPQALGALSLS